jgi:hypothetical protein
MGNDGGSIARRRDLARPKKIKTRVSCAAVARAKSKLCALTQEPLDPPVVSCKLGYLYNKEALLNCILKNKLPSEFCHIKSIRNVQDVKLEKSGNSIICPVTRIEMNGVNPFKLMWDCGCLLSGKALEEIPSQSCLACGKEIGQVVTIGQTKEEQKRLRKSWGIKVSKKEGKSEKRQNLEKIEGQESGKEIRKKIKILDDDEIERNIENSKKSEVFQSLFKKEEYSETFCCRNLRAGLR